MTQFKTLRRPRKWSKKFQILIRRIHLFAGLLMFPWVILYGFTALLFNHSTWFQDRNTSINHFQLNAEQISLVPTAQKQSQAVFAALAAKFNEPGSSSHDIKFDSTQAPDLQGMLVALVDQPKEFVAVIMDPKTGAGFVRRINRPKKKQSLNLRADQAKLAAMLAEPIGLEMQSAEVNWLQAVKRILPQLGVDANMAQLQQVPRVEFSILAGDKSIPLRFAPALVAPESAESAPLSAETPADDLWLRSSGELIAVDVNQRDLSWRSYLLSLHLAHGYPFETTIRWFWAMAVDLMFASMMFWGFSGLIMWWQIKRTRRIGWCLLFVSAVVAFALAYGMHLDFANGTPL
jgi:hypothetical protein